MSAVVINSSMETSRIPRSLARFSERGVAPYDLAFEGLQRETTRRPPCSGRPRPRPSPSARAIRRSGSFPLLDAGVSLGMLRPGEPAAQGYVPRRLELPKARSGR